MKRQLINLIKITNKNNHSLLNSRSLTFGSKNSSKKEIYDKALRSSIEALSSLNEGEKDTEVKQVREKMIISLEDQLNMMKQMKNEEFEAQLAQIESSNKGK